MNSRDKAIFDTKKFFHLMKMGTPPIRDNWEDHKHVSASVIPYGPYTISTVASHNRPGAVAVTVYDFNKETTTSSRILNMETTPELAAKFTQEAIAAYEQELGQVA
ncbi:hypothetical protein [Corynebacterium marquesiae]|uniref:hypothetical protein n=1 Tax=Corynebacterium marquesiae TaxID=2913503 RepID=UPI0038CF512E